MNPIPPGCDHPQADPPHLVCAHMLPANEAEFQRWYTGEGLRYAIVCAGCAADERSRATALRAVCANCFERVVADNYWDSVAGAPGIAQRATSLRFQHQDVALPEGCPSPLRAIAPLDASPSSQWVALGADMRLVLLDLDHGSAQPLATLPAAPLDSAAPLAIHLSPDGRFAAVVNTFGQHGLVVDLATGAPTMTLERGDYHIDFCQFSVAFCTHEDRPLLIHATDWNRLDLSDPRTGALLTPRGPTSYRRGEPRPEHHLNYFHCGLSASPGQEWVVDNGWVWHPWGIVRSWSLSRWISLNPWESEDGSSLRALCGRNYLWDAPLCWIDATTLAVWGEGRDDEQMLPAVLLFDVVSGAQVGGFAGPDVAPHSVWPPSKARRGWMTFDRWLFAVSPQHGTGVWDVATGERLHHDPACTPIAYHRGAKQFLTVLADGSPILSTFVGED